MNHESTMRVSVEQNKNLADRHRHTWMVTRHQCRVESITLALSKVTENANEEKFYSIFSLSNVHMHLLQARRQDM